MEKDQSDRDNDHIHTDLNKKIVYLMPDIFIQPMFCLHSDSNGKIAHMRPLLVGLSVNSTCFEIELLGHFGF
uniref:Uncharacterized protein n=1 Tax=Rhizophora mucronata TaxID=61149 RepID=A0A2P2ILW6_RHIMU